MAGVSLLALLDDIAALLDDVSVMTKVAARKTAGVLGDDLAVNAEKVTGVAADRELPVVFAVFKGSLLNKAILVPAALLIAAVAGWLVSPLLMAGGLFLCYEGFEKVWHFFADSAEEKHAATVALRDKLEDPTTDPLQLEKDRIQGAIRTDFILSAEIIVITLGIVGESSLVLKAAVLTTIALAMTIGVYGVVAGIVKIDDLGLRLAQLQRDSALGATLRWFGRCLLVFAPRLMQFLTIFGTLAMFLVGGGILVHGLHALHLWSEGFTQFSAGLLGYAAGGQDGVSSGIGGVGGIAALLAPHLFSAGIGLFAGAITLVIVSALRPLLRRLPTLPWKKA
ncbi:MAG: DUF808 domain-containing protein [Congregibacter sp.]